MKRRNHLMIWNVKTWRAGNLYIYLIKYEADTSAQLFNNDLANSENEQIEWNLVYISSIYKKENKIAYNNYRGINIIISIVVQ